MHYYAYERDMGQCLGKVMDLIGPIPQTAFVAYVGTMMSITPEGYIGFARTDEVYLVEGPDHENGKVAAGTMPKPEGGRSGG